MRLGARVLVLRALVRGGPATAAELARRTGLCAPAVHGALRGLGRRYRAEGSLMGLGLAVRPHGGSRCIYEVTRSGIEVELWIGDSAIAEGAVQEFLMPQGLVRRGA